jgi:glycosyltransferase involved in cell wall biosynthesis
MNGGPTEWEKFADLLVSGGRPDEALDFYDRAVRRGTGTAGPPSSASDVELRDAPAPLASDELRRIDARPLEIPDGDIVVCSVVRNEAARLPEFLDHYRRLGARRFFLIDNDSSDETLSLALRESDCNVWQARGSFFRSGFGSRWFRILLDTHGHDRWCLIVDADELFTYENDDVRSLRDLCAELDARNERALGAVLLDMYSNRPVVDTHQTPGSSALESCPYFDRQWFHYRHSQVGPHRSQTLYRGGMRRRVFGGPSDSFWLQKVPLVRYRRGTNLFGGQHWADVTSDELAEERACLLHFKYFSDFSRRALVEAERKEHADGAREYALYARAFSQNPRLGLFDERHSVELREGSRQLAKLGIIGRKRGLERLSGAAPSRARRVLVYTDCPGIYGAEQVNHAIVRRLVEDGLRVCVVQSFADHRLVDERRALGVEHVWLEFDTVADAGEGYVRAQTNHAEAARLLRETAPDLVLFADGLPVSSLAAKKAARELGVPFVILEHRVEPDYWPVGARLPVDDVAAAYEAARGIATVCEDALRSLRTDFGLAPDKGEVIYNGVPVAYFRPRDPPARDRVRRSLGIAEDAVVSLTTARLDRTKGFQYQLAAIRALRGSELWPRLVFLWAGDGRAREALDLGLARLGIAERVRMLGEQENVSDLLDAADLFVLPSRREALSRSLLEAMAKGLPVAASAVNGTPEALGPTGHLLPSARLDPRRTVLAMVDIVLAWGRDAQLRQAVGAACRLRAIELFTEERMLDRHSAFVRRALD